MIDAYVLGMADDQAVLVYGDPPVIHDDSAWLIFVHAGSRLNPDLARSLRRHAAARPDVSVFYADEAFAGGQRSYKPSFDKTQLWTQDCVGLPLAVRAHALREIGELQLQRLGASYDLVLRVSALGHGVALAEEVWAEASVQSAPPDPEVRREILCNLPGAPAAGFDLPLGRICEVLQPIRRFSNAPAVTLLLQCADELTAAQVTRLAQDLRTVRWPRDRLMIVAPSAAAAQLRTRLGAELAVAGAGTDGDVSHSWRQSTTEHVVFWQPDLAPTGPDWLEALMTYGVDADVGAVGIRRLDLQGRIGHVGLVTTGPGVLSHPFAGLPAEAAGYGNWAVVAREWSAVEGTVLASRRTVLEAANGFDPRVGAQLAAPDLCLRLGLLGYRIVSTPAAEFVETSPPPPSSGGRPEETAFFLERWSAYRGVDPHWRSALISAAGDVLPLQEQPNGWRSSI